MRHELHELTQMAADPLWRTVLNWGAVATFLTLPLLILAVQLYNWTHPGFMQADPVRVDRLREFLGEYMRNITVLVFGLAGLRTFEQIKANGKPGAPPKKVGSGKWEVGSRTT